jgi:carboxypeptidase Q
LQIETATTEGNIMFIRYAFVTLLCCSLCYAQVSAPQLSARKLPALAENDPIARIRDEGMHRSQVMQTLSYLTDGIGPRLTGSPALKRANEWTRDRLASWGLQNSHLEPWGPFGRGWTLKRFSAQVTEPQSFPLNAYPKAWSPGIRGTLVADVIYVDAGNETELLKFKGRLKGAIVLTGPTREIKLNFEPLARRQTEKELLALANAPDPPPNPAPRFQQTTEQRGVGTLTALKYQFFTNEGAALLVDPSGEGDGGTVSVQAALVPQPFFEYRFDARRVWPWQPSASRIPPQIVVAIEQYNRMVRMLNQGQKLRMEVNLGVEFQDSDLMAYNTIAEIPGSDPEGEVVMLGAHLDSWHAGTGATDNGTGIAVVMEAVRILQTLGLKPRRTIRIALWSGEEQGLRGSRSYVISHFAAAGDGSLQALMDAIRDVVPGTKLHTKFEYNRLSVYFNVDTGTGKFRGLYLQGNEAARPMLRSWLTPFSEEGTSTLSISNIEGSDHLSFDAVGLPGLQPIQDQIEYRTRTWHTNQDFLDRAIENDLKHNAVVLATLVYNAAIADLRFPRKSGFNTN